MNEKRERNRRKSLVGTVICRSGDKTIKVACFYKKPHASYGKEIKRKTVVHVHDEQNQCVAGDSVKVVETRPLSKTKRWRLEAVLSSMKISENND